MVPWKRKRIFKAMWENRSWLKPACTLVGFLQSAHVFVRRPVHFWEMTPTLLWKKDGAFYLKYKAVSVNEKRQFTWCTLCTLGATCCWFLSPFFVIPPSLFSKTVTEVFFWWLRTQYYVMRICLELSTTIANGAYFQVCVDRVAAQGCNPISVYLGMSPINYTDFWVNVHRVCLGIIALCLLNIHY